LLIWVSACVSGGTRDAGKWPWRGGARTGYNSFFKYPGKKFVDVEDSIALDYEKAKPGSALPWDTVRPAVNAVWERMAGIISPRDPGRGVRDWI
jgi:hypothetical protein